MRSFSHMSFPQASASGAKLGLLVGALLVVGVVATGQTFGQRCRAANPHATAAQQAACVQTLSRGPAPVTGN